MTLEELRRIVQRFKCDNVILFSNGAMMFVWPDTTRRFETETDLRLAIERLGNADLASVATRKGATTS